jgi:hypothetical protein
MRTPVPAAYTGLDLNPADAAAARQAPTLLFFPKMRGR